MFSAGPDPELKTPRILATLLDAAGMTPAGLARRTHVSAAEVSNIRHGRRPGGQRWAQLADAALGGSGVLAAAWEADEDTRRTRRLLTSATATAEELLAAPDAGTVDAIHGRIAAIGVDYLHLRAPGGPLLAAAGELQHECARRLRDRACPPRDLRELQAATSRVCGIIAYAALDLGRSAAADVNAAAAFRLGGQAQMSELQAWARGTQSLIARYERDYARAEALVHDGLRHAGKRSGTAGIRLLAGGAQCRANLGDAAGALELLDEAAAQRRDYHPRDEISGLFAFSEAKQRYYGGSSLMWLPGAAALRKAARDSAAAITMWDEGPDGTRSLADQALARVYRATALARLGDLDEAMTAVAPVLDLPGPQRISWLRRRMGELAEITSSGRYAGSAPGQQVAQSLHEWAEQ
jgi:tetratricopeptide (TPR) repeat protein